MAKVSTNISLDSDLGIDLSTVTRENPNAETMAAMNEYFEMKAHPEKYKRYSSFRDAMNEVLEDKDA